jgi:DNA sulfur modification protein DndB
MESVFPRTESDIDLEQKQFATLKAIKGKQFGKDVYSSVIRFDDLRNFLEIFPSVQRDIIPRKVSSLRRYIISGLEKDNHVSMRFFSAMTVSCKGNIYYNEDTHRMAIDTFESKLSINDGQHRYLSIISAIEVLEQEFVKSKDKRKTAKIKGWIDELKSMIIPVVVFDGLTEKEEKQLFHDLNNLQQRPSRNANIRLNQTDQFSRMSRELATTNKYLLHYGVEMDKMSIQKNNPNAILLTTIYASIKEILGAEYKGNHYFLNKDNYDTYKDVIEDTLNKLFYALPPDLEVKEKYIIERSYAIKAICRFICHARHHEDLKLSDDAIFEIINKTDWTLNVKYWGMYGGTKGTNGGIVFGGGYGGGFRAVYDILIDRAKAMARKEALNESLESIAN